VLMQNMQDRGLGAYYQVWLQQSQYSLYARYGGWYLLMMVVWYVSLYRIGMLPGYMQGYSSCCKSLGKAHDVGKVPEVPTMDQTYKMADSDTMSMHIMTRTFLLRQEELSRLVWF